MLYSNAPPLTLTLSALWQSRYPSMERCTRFFTCFLYSFLSSSLLEKARDAASGLRCVAGSGDGFDASSPTSACVVRTRWSPRVKRRLCAAPGLRCGAQAAQALLYSTSALEYGGPPRASVRALREPQVAGSAAGGRLCCCQGGAFDQARAPSAAS